MKPRILKDIHAKEVSLVGKAANNKVFLFAKQKNFKITIDSDGTNKGTSIFVNGENIGEIQSFNFSIYNSSGGLEVAGSPINCSYSKLVDNKDGFKRSEQYYLSKGVSVMKNTQIEKTVQDYFGDGEVIDFTKKVACDDEIVAEVNNAIILISKYKPEFPEDLANAVGIILKQASVGDVFATEEIEKKDNKETLEKIEKIKASIKELEAMLPVEKQIVDKKEDAATEELKKSIKELNEKIEKVATTEKKDNDKIELEKSVKTLTDQVTALEKKLAGKKSVDSEEEEIELKKDGDKWPSLTNQNNNDDNQE